MQLPCAGGRATARAVSTLGRASRRRFSRRRPRELLFVLAVLKEHSCTLCVLYEVCVTLTQWSVTRSRSEAGVSVSRSRMRARAPYPRRRRCCVNKAFITLTNLQVGPVHSIRVCRDTVTRRSLGYAYVNYNVSVDPDAGATLSWHALLARPSHKIWSDVPGCVTSLWLDCLSYCPHPLLGPCHCRILELR